MKNVNEIVDKLIAEKGKEKESVIPILQGIQDTFNFLPNEALDRVREKSNITPSQITGVASFYSQFRLVPAGKHTIKVCVGTACHVKGAGQVYDAFKRHLRIPPNRDTDKEQKFTVEKVACLGCCTLAPVVQIDDYTYGHVSSEKISGIVKDFLSKADENEGKAAKGFQEDSELEGEIKIGLGSCCIASGSGDVQEALKKSLEKTKVNVNVKHVGCVGMCHNVPMIEIVKPNTEPAFYAKVLEEDVSKIIRKHFPPKGIINKASEGINNFLENLIYKKEENEFESFPFSLRDEPISAFLDKQIGITTELSGDLKPSDIYEYLDKEGFLAAKKCITKLKPQDICNSIIESGLRGRGGAGFPTGVKWDIVSKSDSKEKYIICNGDEGDPGAFMDRMLLESYPYRIIEGMIIAAYATGINKGVFYIRAEYPLAVKRIKDALEVCKEKGLIGKNIMKSNFSLDLEVFEGAGAFVCGEETALITSMEGNRGMPLIRPPFPVEKGYKGKPTLVNNAETLATIPWIIRKGNKEFEKIGTDKSKGTKVFALAGKIARGGLIEVPMGITIREIVEQIGGGIANNKEFKAVQIGGPSGGCIPASMSNIPIDYESLLDAGAMMGSGGLVVLDDADCMVDIAKYFLSFTQDQSCGKCTFCRVGTKRMLEILERITQGKGKASDLDQLDHLSKSIKANSLCGLGKSAPNPVISTLKYFRSEYEAHINGSCPAKKCEDLITYSITDDCIGCTKCAQRCPVGAIEFKPHEIHKIDTEKCIKCDSCKQICPEDTVIIT